MHTRCRIWLYTQYYILIRIHTSISSWFRPMITCTYHYLLTIIPIILYLLPILAYSSILIPYIRWWFSWILPVIILNSCWLVSFEVVYSRFVCIISVVICRFSETIHKFEFLHGLFYFELVRLDKVQESITELFAHF